MEFVEVIIIEDNSCRLGNGGDMITVEKLREMGCNVDEGLERCFGNEEMYLRLVGMIPGDANFDGLKAAIEQDDIKQAFEHAHALKGVLGNLSLTSMYDTAVTITELLRAETVMDYRPLLDELLGKRDELLKMLED